MNDDVAKLSAAEFHQQKTEQNAYLRRQLHALNKLTSSKRRRYQILEIRCGACQGVLLEIIKTVPYPVIRYRRTTGHPSVIPLPFDASVAARVERMKSTPAPLRQDDWSFAPLPDPIPAPSGEGIALVATTCRCRQITLTEDYVFGLVAAGTRKKVLHHRR